MVDVAHDRHHRRTRQRHEEGEEHDEAEQAAAPEPVIREISVPETITVADLARKMSVKAAEIIKTMMKLGTMVTINQSMRSATVIVSGTEISRMTGSGAAACSASSCSSPSSWRCLPLFGCFQPAPPVTSPPRSLRARRRAASS
ncbi:MAG: hypothetical protein E6H73_12695 [Betaproteobacteria bacterium]|nr:MAG: hypothetical protein E6H73_12695 [Betaproteobacteria bacterium]